MARFLQHAPRALPSRLGVVALVFAAAASFSTLHPAHAAAPARSGTYGVVASLTAADGRQFQSPLTKGSDGLMYGVAYAGGANGYGTVFRVEADGSVTVVHAFAKSDGGGPFAALTLAPDGWLYGSTIFGGAGDEGVIYKISPAGDFVIAHSFTSSDDQGLASPQSPLLPDGQGGFYGTGVLASKPGAGVIFQWTSGGQFKILDEFKGDRLGRGPTSLALSPSGVLFGTTARGPGVNGNGTVFSLKPGGALKTLHAFDYATEGSGPGTTLVMGPDKAIYGILRRAGPGGDGAVFRTSFSGDFAIVHAFDSSDALGFYPWDGLARDESGTLYGTTNAGGRLSGGTVFSMTRKGSGHVLQALGPSKRAKGYGPNAAPTWDAASDALWGINTFGGHADAGTIFRVDFAQ